MGFMGLVGLVTSCTSEEVEEPEKTSVPVEVQGYMANHQETFTVTRGWQPPTTPTPGFTLYDATKSIIGISFTQDNKDPIYGHFWRSSGKWRTLIDIKTSETFYLYGYIPHNTGVSFEVTDKDGNKANFSEGAVMHLNNLPTITPEDLCIVVGAKNGKDDYKASGDYTVTGLQQGDFSYEAKAMGENPKGNYVFLLFDHLYSALRLRIRVDGDYNKLRTIKLKKIQLQTSTDAGLTKRKTNVTITLNKTTDESSPIALDEFGNELIEFTPVGTLTSDSVVFSSKDGHLLTTDYQPFQSHFMPKGVTKLIVTSTYDIYDKDTSVNPDGNLVRKDCKATNIIQLNKIVDRFTETKRGYRYTLNMTIQPTYLYMLSEPDLDSPTVVMSE
jgi:hypothetical protein